MSALSTLTVSQAAALLGRSERYIHQLRERGYITIDQPGRYPVVSLVRGALAYYEDLQTKSTETAAASRATDARTREIEQRIRRRAATLVPRADVHQVLDEMVDAVASEMTRLVDRTPIFGADRRAEFAQEICSSMARVTALRDAAKTNLDDGV